jgi:hypothetical protein
LLHSLLLGLYNRTTRSRKSKDMLVAFLLFITSSELTTCYKELSFLSLLFNYNTLGQHPHIQTNMWGRLRGRAEHITQLLLEFLFYIHNKYTAAMTVTLLLFLTVRRSKPNNYQPEPIFVWYIFNFMGNEICLPSSPLGRYPKLQ